MVLLMPNGDTKTGGSYMSQGPDGRIVSNVGAQGTAKSGSCLGLLRLERMGIARHGRWKDRGRRRHILRRATARRLAVEACRVGATWSSFRPLQRLPVKLVTFQRNVIMLLRRA